MSVSQRALRLATVLLVMLLAGAALASAASAEILINRWTNAPLAVANGVPMAQAGAAVPNWVLEETDEGFVRIKNGATGEYLHVENGPLALGQAGPGWWSAQWLREPTGDGFTRFKNRWTGVYLTVGEQSPVVAAAQIKPDWVGAQWQVTRAFPETYTSGPSYSGAITSLTPEERACFDNVNGKVAWNRAGSTAWGNGNILKLCEGTRYPQVRLKCFQSEVQRTDDWELAVMSCKHAEASLKPAMQTGDAFSFLQCRDLKINVEGLDWQTADAQCAAEQTAPADDPSKAQTGALPTLSELEQICFDAVQGKVAWNQQGNTQWLESNVRILCGQTPNPEWTVSCFQQQIASHGDARQGITACKASTQQALGNTIPPRQTLQAPPSGADAGALCAEILECAFDTAHGFAPASICSSCGSDINTVIGSLQKFVKSPSFGAGCAAANELKWLKDTITGGFLSAVSMTICQVAPENTGLNPLCNAECSNACVQHLNDQRLYKTCILQCGCGWDEIICEQGTGLLAQSACQAIGLLK